MSGNRIPIIGTVDLKFTLDNTIRHVEALVTKGSPLNKTIIGWKTLTTLASSN